MCVGYDVYPIADHLREIGPDSVCDELFRIATVQPVAEMLDTLGVMRPFGPVTNTSGRAVNAVGNVTSFVNPVFEAALPAYIVISSA